MVTKSGKSDQKTISVTAGIDIINWQGNSNTFNLGNGNDQLFVVGNSNIFNLGNGNDLLNITGNSNLFYLGNGNDSALVRGSSNVINSGNGDDSINLSGNSNIIHGEAGSDTLVLNGNGNAIDGFSAITILNASFGNRIFGSNASAVLKGDTSARFEGNNNRIGSEGVTNIEIIGDGNLYSYDRSLKKMDPGISVLNFGITVKGNNNKIVERSVDNTYIKFRETSSLDITGMNNTIEAQQAIVNLNNKYQSNTSISGNNNLINYNFYYDTMSEGLSISGQNNVLNLNPTSDSREDVTSDIYLAGLVYSQTSLTININEEKDRFRLMLDGATNNKALHKISINSSPGFQLDFIRDDMSGYASFFIKHEDHWLGRISGLSGNDDVYYNGNRIYDGS